MLIVAIKVSPIVVDNAKKDYFSQHWAETVK